VRIYFLKITILPRPVSAMIEIKVPANQKIVQEIPLVNTSKRDWPVKATFTRENNGIPYKNSHWFKGKQDIIIPKESQTNY